MTSAETQAQIAELRTAAFQMLATASEMEHKLVEDSSTVTRTAHLDSLIELAKLKYVERRRRERTLAATLFAEPAWDILLDLFIYTSRGSAILVSSACVAACVPTSTALRWLGALEKAGLVESTQDMKDHRRRMVRLSRKGIRAMSEYLAGYKVDSLVQTSVSSEDANSQISLTKPRQAG